jgi:hypothetical protein
LGQWVIKVEVCWLENFGLIDRKAKLGEFVANSDGVEAPTNGTL